MRVLSSWLVLARALASPGGSNREFTNGPWLVPGEHSSAGCIKDAAWFCETCCCKFGNSHWRDYRLDNEQASPDMEGVHDPESLGESKPTTSEVCAPPHAGSARHH